MSKETVFLSKILETKGQLFSMLKLGGKSQTRRQPWWRCMSVRLGIMRICISMRKLMMRVLRCMLGKKLVLVLNQQSFLPMDQE